MTMPRSVPVTVVAFSGDEQNGQAIDGMAIELAALARKLRAKKGETEGDFAPATSPIDPAPDTLTDVSESIEPEVSTVPTVTRKRAPKPKATTRECAYCHHESISVIMSERATKEAGRDIYFCRDVKKCNERAEAQGIVFHLAVQ